MKKVGLVLILVAALLVSVFALAACPGPDDPAPTSIAVVAGSFRTQYFVGDEFDRSQGRITVTYGDGTTREVEFSSLAVDFSGFNSSVQGPIDVVATYRGLESAPFRVSVQNINVYSVTVTGYRLQYFVGDTFDRTQGTMHIVFNNDIEETLAFANTRITFANFNSSAPVVNQAITATATTAHGNATYTFYIDVNAARPVAIEVVNYRAVQAQNAPTFDRGLLARVNIEYDNGDILNVPFDARFTVTGFVSSAVVASQVITVSYEGVYTTITVSVQGGTTPISIVAGLNNMTLFDFPIMLQGETLDRLDEVMVEIAYANFTTRTVSFNAEDEIVLHFDNMNVGETPVIFYYRGATIAMNVYIEKNWVLYVNTLAAEIASVSPTAATRAQRDIAVRAIRAFVSELNSNMAGIHVDNFENAVAVAFVISYTGVNTNFELAASRIVWVNDVASVTLDGGRAGIESWINAMRSLLESLQDLVYLEDVDVLWQGLPISERIADHLDWFDRAGGMALMSAVYMFEGAVDIYEIFDGVTVANREDALSPAVVAATNAVRNHIDGMPLSIAQNVFRILDNWRPVIYDAMIYHFFRSDDIGWVHAMEQIFIPSDFIAVRQLGASANWYFQNQRFFGVTGQQNPDNVQIHDASSFYVVFNRFVSAVEVLDNSTRWYFIEAVHNMPLLRAGFSLNNPGAPGHGQPIYITYAGLIEFVIFGDTVGFHAIPGGQATMMLRIPYTSPTIANRKTDATINSGVFDDFFDLYIDWLNNYGRTVAGGFELSPNSIGLEQFNIDTRAFLEAFVYLPSTYQWIFFDLIYRGGIETNAQPLGGGVTFENRTLRAYFIDELTYLQPFLRGTYVYLFNNSPVLINLLLNMMRAVEYNMFATQSIIQRQRFIDFFDTNVSTPRGNLSAANEALFEEHLGFFYDRLLHLRNIGAQVGAGTFNPTIDTRWENAFERLERYIHSMSEALFRTGQVAPEGYRRTSRIAVYSSYARIRALHRYIMNNAPQSVIDVYFSVDSFVVENWVFRGTNHPNQALSTMVLTWANNTIQNYLRAAQTISGFAGRLQGRMTEEVWELYYELFDLVWASFEYQFRGTNFAVAWAPYTLQQIPMSRFAQFLTMINDLDIDSKYVFFAANSIPLPTTPPSISHEHHALVSHYLTVTLGADDLLAQFVGALVSMERYIFEFYLFEDQIAVDAILGRERGTYPNIVPAGGGIVRLRERRAAITGAIDPALQALYNRFNAWVADLEANWVE